MIKELYDSWNLKRTVINRYCYFLAIVVLVYSKDDNNNNNNNNESYKIIRVFW
jgi:hypothetical protein